MSDEPDTCAQCRAVVADLTPAARAPWAEEGVCAPCLAMDLAGMADDCRTQAAAIAGVARRWADVLPEATVAECEALSRG